MIRACGALVLLLAAGAGAEPRQCLGRGSSQWMADETFLGIVRPEGFENQLRGGICVPLTTREGLLFDYAQLELGLNSYISPVYVHLGPYLMVSPLSFLVLRADLMPLVIWPLPIDGAGYFELPAYQRDLSNLPLAASDARSALGINGTVSATLQGAVDLTSWFELILVDTGALDWFFVGTGPYYVNQRRDLVLARSDFLLKNTAFLFLDFKVGSGVSLRLGAVDDLTYVPGSHELQNIASGFISVPIRRDAKLRDIEPYARIGAYTAHGWRRGFTLMVGISFGLQTPMGSPP